MRNVITTAMTLCGLGFLALGAGLAYLPAGVIVAGVGLIVVGERSDLAHTDRQADR